MRYTVVLMSEPEIDGYIAYVPAVRVTTQGYSIEHALEMAAEATGLKLDVMTEDGEELPIEHPGTIVTSVEVALGESVAPDAIVTSAAATD